MSVIWGLIKAWAVVNLIACVALPVMQEKGKFDVDKFWSDMAGDDDDVSGK